MSGGSYDYLFSGVRALESQRDALYRMAEQLEELPYASRAAEDTRRVISLMEAARELAEKLSEVWHDVEWWDSGDYGEKTVKETCEEYAETEPLYWVQS